MSKIKQKLNDTGVCIIGVGYVGIQLSVLFSQNNIKTYGFDIDTDKINNYKNGIDITEYATKEQLDKINFVSELPNVSIYIITVPTPIHTQSKQPDLRLLREATVMVAKHIKQGDLIVYESTVAPKTTRNVCIPLLEKHSKMKFGNDFFVGFSPERLQAGKKNTEITDNVKLVSGANEASSNMVFDLYNSVIPKNKLHRCDSMEIAEMAKLMENVKRDVNIALMNYFQMICCSSDIKFDKVLKAARTKSNFDDNRYFPGLVGGHCISVDPYYLIKFKHDEANNVPSRFVSSARDTNESVAMFLAFQIQRMLNYKQHAQVTICGFSFKEYCADIRNTKIFDLYNVLKNNIKYDVYVYDPKCDKDLVKKIYGIDLVNEIPDNNDCIFLALKEEEYLKMSYNNKLSKEGFIFDYKYLIRDMYPLEIFGSTLDGFNSHNKLPIDKVYTM